MHNSLSNSNIISDEYGLGNKTSCKNPPNNNNVILVLISVQL